MSTKAVWQVLVQEGLWESLLRKNCRVNPYRVLLIRTLSSLLFSIMLFPSLSISIIGNNQYNDYMGKRNIRQDEAALRIIDRINIVSLNSVHIKQLSQQYSIPSVVLVVVLLTDNYTTPTTFVLSCFGLLVNII